MVPCIFPLVSYVFSSDPCFFMRGVLCVAYVLFVVSGLSLLLLVVCCVLCVAGYWLFVACCLLIVVSSFFL